MATESGTNRASVGADLGPGPDAAFRAAPGPLSDVAERLRDNPWCFRFFQAVRLLERLFPERQPVGRFVPPSQEVARFGAHASVCFPASEIQSLTVREGQAPFLEVNFMGLTGPLGVLPQWYTMLIRERLRAGDSTLRDFLDIFTHRSISLFYQAWAKYRFALAYERGDRDRFTHYLLDLVGLGTEGLAERQEVEDDSLVFYAGLLMQKPRSAESLAQILSDYFDVPVEVEQFVGAWYRLDRGTQCCVERPGPAGTSLPGLSEQVGLGAVVGDEMWDQHSRARIKLGPLSLPRYLDFLPNGSAYKPLRALTKFFSNGEYDFEVQLILKQERVPQCQLGAEGEAAPQLGWVTWMKTKPIDRSPGDTVLEP